MAIVLQEVDPDDLTTVLFDYSDQTGVNNIGSVKAFFGVGGTFTLGAPAVSIDNSDRQGDGPRDVVFSYDSLVASAFSVRLQASSYDNLRAAVGTIQRLLSTDGVMRYIPTGSTSTYYIYRKPSSIPALFSGAELELYKAGALTEGTIEIAFNRERLLRGPILLASVNKVTNSTLLGKTTAVSSAPEGWAWVSTANITEAGYGANVNWPNQSYRFTIATTGTRTLQQTGLPPGMAAPGDVWTFSFYAKATGGALCKARGIIEYRTSGGGAIGGGVTTGGLVTLTSTEQRVSVTTGAAPATSSAIIVSIEFANGDATTYTVDLRRAQLEKAAAATQFRVGAESVAGSIVSHWAKAAFFYNPGDANALARITAAPLPGLSPIAFLLGRKSEGLDTNLAEAVNRMGAAATTFRAKVLVKDATMYGGTSGDTSSQADGASTGGGNAAKTTFTNQNSLVRRWRWVTTPTDPEALHGRWDVYCAIRPEVGSATDTRYRVCLHWQAANRDPVTNVEDEIILDATDPTSSVYAPIFMGTVEFDADAGDTALTLEGWAAQDAGAGALWWDVVYLIPSDEQQTLLQVPGFRAGEQGEEIWLGSELTSDGAVNKPAGIVAGAVVTGTKVIFDTVNEGAGMPPSGTSSGGIVWAAGWHVASAMCDLRVPAGTAVSSIGRIRIRKAPGPAGASVKTWAAGVATLGGVAIGVGMFVKPTNANLNGRTYVCTSVAGTHTTGGAEPTWPDSDGGTVTDNPGANQIVWTETTVASRQLQTKKNFTSTRRTFTTAALADGTTAYEIVVVARAGITGAAGKIHVLRVTHTILRVVDDTFSAQMLGDIEVLQTASSANVSTDELVKQGPFITLGPGLNVLWVDQWVLPPFGYDDMTDDPLAKHEPGVGTTVSVDVIPRYWS